jgi:hypothetical protein
MTIRLVCALPKREQTGSRGRSHQPKLGRRQNDKTVQPGQLIEISGMTAISAVISMWAISCPSS